MVTRSNEPRTHGNRNERVTPLGRLRARGCGWRGTHWRVPRADLGSLWRNRGHRPTTLVHVGFASASGALAWVAFKVGALSYGGGFVIVPLMQHDAVTAYHWMTGAQFLNAVALGQVTPGPVVQTVAVVGYAAAGIRGGLLAAVIAFVPSFIFVLAGGSRFNQIRTNQRVQSFLNGAGPAVIGAIGGSAIPLGLSLQHTWQIPVLASALVALTSKRASVVSCLLVAAAIGVVLALFGVGV
ncbi:MAG: chromate transporter [Acidimicrobiales bacterium]